MLEEKMTIRLSIRRKIRMTNSSMVYKHDWIVTSILSMIFNLYTFFSNIILNFFWMVINMEIMIFNIFLRKF